MSDSLWGDLEHPLDRAAAGHMAFPPADPFDRMSTEQTWADQGERHVDMAGGRDRSGQPRGQQLAMFHTAGELMGHLGGDLHDPFSEHGQARVGEHEEVADIHSARVGGSSNYRASGGDYDSYVSSMAESISKHGGVSQPVLVKGGKDPARNTVVNGHHRVNAAFRVGPETLIPVDHTDVRSAQSELGATKERERQSIVGGRKAYVESGKKGAVRYNRPV